MRSFLRGVGRASTIAAGILLLVGCGAVVAALRVGPVALLGVAVLAGVTGYLLGRPHDRRIRFAIQGLAFFAAAPVKFGQFDVADAFFVLAAGLLLAGRPSPERATGTVRVVGLGLAVIAIGGAIALPFAPSSNPFPEAQGYQGSQLLFLPANVSDLLRFVVLTAGMVLLIRHWRPDRREAHGVLWAYALGAGSSVVWGLVVGGGGSRLIGLTDHPVLFGWISAMAVFVGIAVWQRSRWAGAVVAGLAVVGVLGSGTRGGAIVVVAGFLLLPLGRRSLGSAAAVAAVVVVALGVSMFGAALARHSPTLERLTVPSAAQKSTTERGAAARQAWDVIRARPLTGVGMRYLGVPHNLVLGVWVGAGLLGVVGLLIVVLALISELLTAARRAAGVEAVILSGAAAFYLTGWAVNPSWDRWLWLPIALALVRPSTAELKLDLVPASAPR